MAVRYFLRYFDVVDNEHILNIYDDNYEDEAIQVDGKVTLTYSDTDNSLEAVRGQGLSVELEANTNLTFSDLWSENERTFRVEYYRNGDVTFRGWLSPDGFFENYVDSDWLVTFDCVDGLGFLSDFSFVEDATGYPITGRRTYIQILALALYRTGLKQLINTSIDIRYTGLGESLDVMANVYANTDRYIKDDGETIMSCEDVIRDVLEPFGAVLTSLNGEWYVYKPNQLYLNSDVTFYRYTYQGIPLNPEFYPPTKTLNLDKTIGSNVNGYDVYHCNANQSIRNISSVGAYRISYKYGLVQSFLQNTKLCSIDGVTINNWDVLNNTYLEPLVAGECGITLNEGTIATHTDTLRSESITIDGNTQVKLEIDYNFNLVGFSYPSLFYKIQVTDKDINDPTAKIYNLFNFNDGIYWGADGETNLALSVYTLYAKDSFSITAPIPPIELTGDVFVYITLQNPVNFPTATNSIDITNIRISPVESNIDLIGEFHTVQRTTKPSAKVENIKEVATGDNITDLYEGTLYKNDAETPTETWNRKGIEEEKPLLQIMGEETLRLNQSVCRVFSGDIFGYFNYLSVININGLVGKFLPIKFRYDTKSNIINAEFKQVYGEELDDIDYVKTLDYGNTVKPTIR